MCKKCVDMRDELWPELTIEEWSSLLMCTTAFPFADPEHVRSQMVENLANHGKNFMALLAAADVEMENGMRSYQEAMVADENGSKKVGCDS